MTKSIWVVGLSLMLLVASGPDVFAQVSKEPQYGGTISFSRTINPISWDVVDWTWKHGNDTGFYMEHLIMGDLQKGPRGANQYAFQDTDYIPTQFTQGELLESWEVKKDPLQLIFHLRKGVMWQEKPGVMKARSSWPMMWFTASIVLRTRKRPRRDAWISSARWKPRTNTL